MAETLVGRTPPFTEKPQDTRVRTIYIHIPVVVTKTSAFYTVSTWKNECDPSTNTGDRP